MPSKSIYDRFASPRESFNILPDVALSSKFIKKGLILSVSLLDALDFFLYADYSSSPFTCYLYYIAIKDYLF